MNPTAPQIAGAKECFVVMPYGTKPLPDGSGRDYDFEKVWRVLIQRAVREAGMVPVRSDQRVGSALVHGEMFRDLRDRAVVLADLSLDNPNVFYELGIRHVMSPGGTVLICRKGSVLPFDVKLSRVIFYDYDGKHFDWEEVELVVKALKVALADAATGRPDSPVHALLESVMPRGTTAATPGAANIAEQAADAEPCETFQRLVAQAWQQAGQTFEALFDAQRATTFGSRALAYLCLNSRPLTPEARRLANHLNDGQQYRLANQLYEQLLGEGKLTRGSQLAYASSYSEAHPDLDGAKEAIAIAQRALDEVRTSQGAEQDLETVLAQAECRRRLAGLRQWLWQLSNEPSDLARAVAECEEGVRWNERARQLGGLKHPGFLAQIRLKLVVLLRIREGSVDRPDHEGHRDAIMRLAPLPGDDPKGLSYLGWYQALTLADLGQAEAAQRKAVANLGHDSQLRQSAEHWEIGRRQYAQLRRFLEQYLPHLRNPGIFGLIAQLLQDGGR